MSRDDGIIKRRLVRFSASLPGWLRTVLRRWYVVVVAAILTYVSSGLATLIQSGPKAFLSYLLSWALLKPVVEHYPVPFFLALGIVLALVPIGYVIAEEEEVRRFKAVVADDIAVQQARVAQVKHELDRLGEKVQGQSGSGDHVYVITSGPLEGQALEGARRAYLGWVLQLCNQVTLPIGRLQSGEPLYVIFQPLELMGLKSTEIPEDLTSVPRLLPWERPRVENLPQRKEPGRQTALTGLDALSKSPNKRMIALGSPGAGKTTLLKHMAASDAQRALDQTAPSEQQTPLPLPIFIPLADLARHQGSVKAYLLAQFHGAAPGVDLRFADVLMNLLADGRATLYLDALDEVPSGLRPLVLASTGVLDRGSAGSIVISSRFTDYQQDQLKRFTPWLLLPLDHQQRVLLAEHLLPLLGAEASAVPEFVDAVERHRRDIEGARGISAWAESPLLFSLAAVIYVQNDGHLPSSRAGLYHAVVDAILKLKEPSWAERDALCEALGECALIWLTQGKRRTFTFEELRDALKRVRERLAATWDVDDMSERIKRAGVLDTVAQNTYGFSHQTFQEYFAALALANHLARDHGARAEETWHQLWTNRTAARWHQTLRLMMGVLTQRDSSEATSAALRWTAALVGRWRRIRRRGYLLLGLLSAVILGMIAVQLAAFPALFAAAQRVPRALGSWWWLVGTIFVLVGYSFDRLWSSRGRIQVSGGLALVIEALSEIDGSAPFWSDERARRFARQVVIDWAKTLLFSFQHDLYDRELEQLGSTVRELGGPVGGVAQDWLAEKRPLRPSVRRAVGRALAVVRGER
jgi:hypothetical protein